MVEKAPGSPARPQVDVKLVYGQAFAIYALSEYYLATGEGEALALALETYSLLEGVARDTEKGGYYEACDRAWNGPIKFSLSDVDIPCDKSMNTNLHVLEALSNLYRATLRKDVRESLASLLEVYARKVFAGKGATSLYFDRDWKSLTDHVSWGHDIESCWLMKEAADLAYGGRPEPADVSAAIAAAREAGLAVLAENGGSLPHEMAAGHVDGQRDWWVQAEAVVGHVDAWQATGDGRYLAAAVRLWDYIEDKVIDRENGEWFWGVSAEGKPDLSRPKGGLWKTCYHNGRACLEVMARAERATNEKESVMSGFDSRKKSMRKEHEVLVGRKNERVEPGNGIFWRYRYPVLTAAHVPLEWRYDFNAETNPYFMERLGVNAVFNAGAIRRNGKYCVMARVEGCDRKSFFALAESPNGVDGFRFVGEPLLLGDALPGRSGESRDQRLRHAPHRARGRLDLRHFLRRAQGSLRARGRHVYGDRLGGHRAHEGSRELGSVSPDLKTASAQQRNVALHPEFVKGKYLLYTRPQDGFIETGTGGGICVGYADIDDRRPRRRRAPPRPQALPHDQGSEERRRRAADQDRRGLAPHRPRRAQYGRGPSLRSLRLPRRPGRSR